MLLAHNASSLFRAAPYIIFSCMALAAAIVPTLSTQLILAPAADAIALVGLFALAYLAAKTLGLWSSALPPAMLARLYALALGG